MLCRGVVVLVFFLVESTKICRTFIGGEKGSNLAQLCPRSQLHKKVTISWPKYRAPRRRPRPLIPPACHPACGDPRRVTRRMNPPPRGQLVEGLTNADASPVRWIGGAPCPRPIPTNLHTREGGPLPHHCAAGRRTWWTRGWPMGRPPPGTAAATATQEKGGFPSPLPPLPTEGGGEAGFRKVWRSTISGRDPTRGGIGPRGWGGPVIGFPPDSQ